MITKGFNYESIGKLTLRQILLYFKNLQQLDRKNMATNITVVSLGFNGGKEATKIIKELTKTKK